MSDTGRVVPCQLQRMKFIVVKSAQIDAVAVAAALGQTVDSGEEIQALVKLVCQQFDVSEMGNIAGWLVHGSVHQPANTWPSNNLRPCSRRRH